MSQSTISKRAVCIGINNYSGTANDLNGCVNDANDWSEFLSGQYGFDTRLIIDSQATRSEIIGALNDLISSTRSRDRLVLTYSGHGTWVPDQEELDEADNRDEALAVYDGIIVDDELRGILSQVDPSTSFTIISDSCHSGSVTRAALKQAVNRSRASEITDPPIPRFLPPEDDASALKSLMLPVRNRAFYPESAMNHMLLTGCNAMEYSYDAVFSGRYNGAMSFFAIQLIRANPSQTWSELHQSLRQLLPSTQYPQSPQLEGSDANKNKPIFT